ncbi:MAG: hypothetical protein RL238_1929 [Actinomycetota bacterium]|jgi:very-short-patch-repair endonuclease
MPVPNVFVVASSPSTWRQQLAIATACSNEAGSAAYESAGALHAVDGAKEGPLILLVAAPRRVLAENVVVHVGPMDPVDLTIVDGIRCTTIERTLCDLASVRPEFEVMLAFEWYWRRHRDLTVLQAAIDRLHRPGQSGTKVLQRVLSEALLEGLPTESALEVRLEAILRGLPGLVRQHEVIDAAGQFVARVDFALPSLRIAIEAHSAEFHSSEAAHAADEVRHRRLVGAGWRVRYVTSLDMDQPNLVWAEVQTMRRGGPGHATPPVPHLPRT